MKPKTIIRRMIVEVIVVLVTFSASDMLTSPSDSTAAAVLEAVNKRQLEPICLVEVRSAIHSASFMRFALLVVLIGAISLLCSDTWALWQSRWKFQSKH